MTSRTRYAASTTVSPAKSRADIEQTLARCGATAFGYATEGNRAVVMFRMPVDGGTVGVRITLPLPDPYADEFTRTPTGKQREFEAAQRAWEQACRSRWRALLLVIRAKLEAVEAGITTVETEFLAHLCLPGGSTVGEYVESNRAALFEAGDLPMLPGGAP